MVHIELMTVGRLKEEFLKKGCEEFCKRLTPFCRVTVTEMPEERVPDAPSPAQIAAAIEGEGQKILAKIPPRAKIIAMCIEGKMLSSPELSDLLTDYMSGGDSHIVFVIGGSWGLSDAVKQAAHFRLSASKMTFPHQMFRLMLLEQIYRAFQIAGSGKYHK